MESLKDINQRKKKKFSFYLEIIFRSDVTQFLNPVEYTKKGNSRGKISEKPPQCNVLLCGRFYTNNHKIKLGNLLIMRTRTVAQTFKRKANLMIRQKITRMMTTNRGATAKTVSTTFNTGRLFVKE